VLYQQNPALPEKTINSKAGSDFGFGSKQQHLRLWWKKSPLCYQLHAARYTSINKNAAAVEETDAGVVWFKWKAVFTRKLSGADGIRKIMVATIL